MEQPKPDSEVCVLNHRSSPGGELEIVISGRQGAGKSRMLRMIVAMLEANPEEVSNIARRVVLRTVQIVPILLLLIVCAARVDASPINLIANGDFALGAVGFDTDYAIAATNTDEGQIRTAATVAEWGHPLFVDFGPAAGAAAMLLGNGASDSSRRVWAQTVAVEAGVSYAWTAAIAGLCCVEGYPGSPYAIPQARLLFAVDGVGLLVASPDGAAHWTAVGAAWTAAGPSARLEVFDLETVHGGNDWAMTLLALAPVAEPPAAVPEPSTGALATVGALYGLLRLWRARRAA